MATMLATAVLSLQGVAFSTERATSPDTRTAAVGAKQDAVKTDEVADFPTPPSDEADVCRACRRFMLARIAENGLSETFLDRGSAA